MWAGTLNKQSRLLGLKSISFPSLEPVQVEYNDISEISYGDPTLNIESFADPIGVISFKKKLSPCSYISTHVQIWLGLRDDVILASIWQKQAMDFFCTRMDLL